MSTNLFSLNDLPIESRINFKSKINCKVPFFEEDENGRCIHIHSLNDIIFGGQDLFYPNVLSYSKYDKKHYIPINEKIMSLGDNIKFNYKLVDSNIIKKNNKPVFFFIYNTDNYYHFIYDTLPYLITFLELKKQINDLKLLMNYPNSNVKKFYKFISEFLEVVGIQNEDIIIIEKNVLYEKVYISSSYTHDFDSNLPPRKEVYFFLKKIIYQLKSKFNLDTPKKIYISRRSWLHNDSSNIGTNYTLRRKMINENELVSFLKGKGYSEIFTETLSTVEKLNLFHNANNVIGAIGGGLCNVLFSEPHTELITIVSPTFLDVNYRFKYSLEQVKNTYFFDTHHVENGDFKVGMRVKCNENNIIGEIIEVKNDLIKLIYSDSNVAGWNSEQKFNTMYIESNFCQKLDEGLNSSFEVNLKKLENLFF